MPDLHDKLLKMNREELEEKARSLGLEVREGASRAELITLIEQHRAMRELGPFYVQTSEFRLLMAGLLLVAVASFILALDTFYELTSGPYGNPLAPVLIPVYLALRGMGGFLMAAGLFSLALKPGQSLTPVMRATCIVGGIIVILLVIPLLSLSYQWSP